jgi:hypothetical protein
MKTPKKIRIGKRWYTVAVKDRLRPKGQMGWVKFPPISRIEIAQRSGITGRSFTALEISDTFWHEVTHAILNDMEHELCLDEAFVEQFSSRLNNAIHSARF